MKSWSDPVRFMPTGDGRFDADAGYYFIKTNMATDRNGRTDKPEFGKCITLKYCFIK